MSASLPIDVLVVDDNEKNLLAMEATLGDLGANLVLARSGHDALMRLLERDFALILLDVQMPEMDGFEVAGLIRARDRSRATPIIFITAHNRTEAQAFRGYAVGAVDFLFKPVVPEVLRSKVATFIELHRKREEVRAQAERLREAEAREHARSVTEARQRWEKELIREEMEKERRVAEALAQRAEELARSIAEKERVQGALAQSNERLKLLAESSSELLLASKPQDSFPGLLTRLGAHLGLEVHLYYTVDGSGAGLTLSGHRGIPSEAVHSVSKLAFGQALSGQVAKERRPIVAESILSSTRGDLATARALGIAAFACYPLLAHDRLLGTLGFGTRIRPAFQPDELSVMQAVADQVAMALERSLLIEELQQRNVDLKDRDRRKDEFLAMLAHELRNPLAPILNAVKVLQLRAPQGDPVLERAVGAADRQIRHMARLVDDLLDVSRITTGKVELRRQPLELRQVVDQAAQISEPLLRERRHTLEISLPGAPVRLFADPTRITQVLANLLNNAAKYTDPGGTVRVVAELEQGQAVIRVTDTGMGIRPDMLDKVFELFVQTDRSSDRALGGLGIGLTLVRRLVEMHGGSVVAESEGHGKGSVFVVRLPLAEAQPVPEAPRPVDLPSAEDVLEPRGTGSPALDILLVEDNDDIRATLRDLLELHGHRVEEAQDGHQGVEKVLQRKPNVALVDIGLPGLDGYSLAEQVRAAANGNGLRTRLIALTGYGGPEDRRRALAAGFDAHLVKPIDVEQLSRLLKDMF